MVVTSYKESRVTHEAHGLINKESKNRLKDKLKEIFITIKKKIYQGQEAVNLNNCLKVCR